MPLSKRKSSWAYYQHIFCDSLYYNDAVFTGVELIQDRVSLHLY